MSDNERKLPVGDTFFWRGELDRERPSNASTVAAVCRGAHPDVDAARAALVEEVTFVSGAPQEHVEARMRELMT